MKTNSISIDCENYILKNSTLNKILTYSIKNNSTFAIWRLPNQHLLNGLISFNSFSLNEDFNLENLGKGFIISPFINDNKNIIFAPENIKIEIDNNIEVSSTDSDLNEFVNSINDINSENLISYLENYTNENTIEYQNLIDDAVLQIEKGEFQKVVLARSITKNINSNFNPIETLFALSNKYPSAFVSIIYHPEFGLWIGATPELLIEKNKNNIFKTVSVAGTKTFELGSDITETIWHQKEIEEQALVSRYIINQFKKIRVREFDEIGPTVSLAGNLVHLKTEYIVNLNEINFKDLPTVMLKLLHPTPAVCGESKEKSLNYILSHENLNRELYAGFLGPINYDSEINIFVNLRCMKIYKNVLKLFAGAGITKNSIPQSEFEETEAKFKTLLSVLKI